MRHKQSFMPPTTELAWISQQVYSQTRSDDLQIEAQPTTLIFYTDTFAVAEYLQVLIPRLRNRFNGITFKILLWQRQFPVF